MEKTTWSLVSRGSSYLIARNYSPTPFSLIRLCALVFAADMAAGVGPAREPKRRLNMDVMVGEIWGGYMGER